MRKNYTQFPIPPVAIVAAVAVALLVGLIAFFSDPAGETKISDEVREGITYLENLEKKDPAAVQQVRKEIRQKELAAQRDKLLKQLTDGTIDPFSLFQDYVVMGDSRAVGYWYRDFLDKGRVLADGGHTIRNITEQMDTLVSLNPSTIYLCYGLNDISIGYWDTKEDYTSEYIGIIRQIQAELPDATIVVSSILPARDPAFERSSKWRNIPEWSAALEQACKDNGILFANCDQLAVDYPNLWDPDGIHFREDFYPYWASNLVVATLMEGADDEG